MDGRGEKPHYRFAQRRISILLLTISSFVFFASAGMAKKPALPVDPPAAPLLEDPAVELLEAVRLTLRHDPNLLLQKEDARFQLGIVEELRGDFDWVLSGEASYRHEKRELRQSTIDNENKRRANLRETEAEICQDAEEQERKLAEIDAALGSPQGGVPILTDEKLALEIQLLDALIQDAIATGDADRLEELVEKRRLLLVGERELTRRIGEEARTACVETGEALERLGETPEFEEFDTGKLDLRLSKRFRNGIEFSPFANGEYQRHQFTGKRNGFFVPVLDENGQAIVDFDFPRERLIDFGGTNELSLYTVRVGFDVDLPLLRGRGAESAAAAERAAQSDLAAIELLVKHRAARSVLETLIAYWDLLAAQQRLAIFDVSVGQQEKLLGFTKEKIENDDLIPAEESRALASTATARAQAAAARRELAAMQRALAQSLGVRIASAQAAPRATSDFPTPPTSEQIVRLLGEEAELVETAVRGRHDVAAFRTFVGTGRILARAAQLDLRSLVDFRVGVWATANGEDGFSEATDRWTAPNWSLDLKVENPLGNHEQKGLLAQREAQLRQSQISAEDLERNVRIGLIETLRALAEASVRLDFALEAEARFRETIAAENTRFEHGETTLFDAVLTEQQSTAASLTRLDAQREVAVLVAQLRFEAGLLITDDPENGSEITLPALTQLPGTEP